MIVLIVAFVLIALAYMSFIKEGGELKESAFYETPFLAFSNEGTSRSHFMVR